jgi:nucleoside-diphosphate-sugar epimerase
MAASHLIVTGAGGFLGRATVAAALARGHRVTALIRTEADLPPGAIRAVADLAGGGDLRPLLAGADAIIHCAGRMTGTEAQMQRDTVGGTAALLVATPPQTRLVLVSSMAVYGAARLRPGAVLDEGCPIEDRPALRDAYARTKLRQEMAVRGGRLMHWIVRPGLIWDPAHLDNAHLGVGLGPLFLRIGSDGELPLAHVTNVAEALVNAAERWPVPGAEVANIVDDIRPTRADWLAAIPAGRRLTLPLHWRLPDLAAGLASPLGPRVPGLLRRPTLRARLMPLRYSNAAAKDRLGWAPRVAFPQGLAP